MQSGRLRPMSLILSAKILATAALAAGSTAGTALGLSAASAAAPVPHAGYACVNLATHTAMTILDTPSAACPAGTTSVVIGAQGPAGVKGATGPQGPAGPQGPPGMNAGPLTVTSVISISKDPDSNNSGGTWATDAITRTFTVTRHAAAPLADCPSAPAGNDTCYYYTGTLADSGQFVTISGAKSPNDGSVTISGDNPGTFSGGSSFEFYADSAALQASSLSMVDESVTPFAGSSDPKWYASFFPKGASVDSVGEPNWSWTYQTSNTCEAMTQAFSGETGNITGVSHCTS